MPAATRLQLIQRAQVRIGDEPIAAENAPGADTYTAIYDSVLEDLLSRHRWSFAMATGQIARLVAEPPAHWTYYYQLPPTMIGAPYAVFDRDDLRVPFTAYEIVGDRLASNAETVFLRYPIRVDAVLWPGYFAALFNTVLMAEYALSVREDADLHARLMVIAFGAPELRGEGGQFEQARAADLLAQPPPEIWDRVVDDLLGRYPWSFALHTAELEEADGEPAAHWTRHFTLPADRVALPRAVYDRSDARVPTTAYELAGDKVLTNAEALWVRYVRRAPQAAWPGNFRQLVDTAVKAEVALSIGRRTLYESLTAVAFGPASMLGEGGLMGQAKGLDAQTQPSPVVAEGSSPLVAARR